MEQLKLWQLLEGAHPPPDAPQSDGDVGSDEHGEGESHYGAAEARASGRAPAAAGAGFGGARGAREQLAGVNRHGVEEEAGVDEGPDAAGGMCTGASSARSVDVPQQPRWSPAKVGGLPSACHCSAS